MRIGRERTFEGNRSRMRDGSGGDECLGSPALPAGKGRLALRLHGATLSLPLGKERKPWWRRRQLLPAGALDLVHATLMGDVHRTGPRPASASESLLVKWMGITDANSAGFVHGGMVMKLCDEAAGLAALRHCGMRIVTAAADRMTFLHPVSVGNLVTCRAKVNAVWRTSMEIGVRVEAENPRSGEAHHTSTAYLTMVAVDENGEPVSVPPLGAETEDEIRRQHEAGLRRANRLAERDQIRAGRDD